MKIPVLLCVLYILPFLQANAQIRLASGGGGSITLVGQSFNETRAVDVHVLSTQDIRLSAMTLHGFFTGQSNKALVGARIYDSASSALLYSHDTLAYNKSNGSITIPVSFVMQRSHTYRIGFFCGTDASSNSALMYEPAAFPYAEAGGLLRVMHAYSTIKDTFPRLDNIFVPIIDLSYQLASGVFDHPVSGTVIAPNPAGQTLAVRLDRIRGSLKGEIQDVQGRSVFSRYYTAVQSFAIPLNDLPFGVYFLKLSGNGYSETLRFVKGFE